MATQGYKMENAKTTLNETNTLHTTRNNIVAFGVYDGENFEVLEGSQIDMSRKGRSSVVDQQRESAVKNGDIVLKDGKYYLTISMSFTSPSSASCFVLGGSTNGWTEWKDKDGNTLDSVYRRQLE